MGAESAKGTGRGLPLLCYISYWIIFCFVLFLLFLFLLLGEERRYSHSPLKKHFSSCTGIAAVVTATVITVRAAIVFVIP